MVVHEQTKHFKGALSTPTQSKENTLSTPKEEAFSSKCETSAAPTPPCAPSHTARKEPSAECPDSTAKSTKSVQVPPATDVVSAAPIVEPKTESAAETARDFKSLISEKVGTPKRKRRRIGQEALFSTADPYKNKHK